MRIIPNKLSIEVTRRCNLRCDHCLRGDPENVDITPGLLEKVLKQIDSVGNCVTLTGGEPLLLEWLPELLMRLTAGKDGDMIFGSIYIATNGTKFTERIINAFNMTHERMYQEFSVQISLDEFHKWQLDGETFECLDDYYAFEGVEVPEWTIQDVNEFVEQMPWAYEARDEINNPKALYNRGRAEYFSLGQRPNDDNCNECKRGMIMIDKDTEVEDLEGSERWVDSLCYKGEEGRELHLCQLHISANGNVNLNCNHSFDDVDEDHIGNLNNMDLETMLLRHYKKIGYDESHLKATKKDVINNGFQETKDERAKV